MDLVVANDMGFSKEPSTPQQAKATLEGLSPLSVLAATYDSVEDTTGGQCVLQV